MLEASFNPGLIYDRLETCLHPSNNSQLYKQIMQSLMAAVKCKMSHFWFREVKQWRLLSNGRSYKLCLAWICSPTYLATWGSNLQVQMTGYPSMTSICFLQTFEMNSYELKTSRGEWDHIFRVLRVPELGVWQSPGLSGREWREGLQQDLPATGKWVGFFNIKQILL